MAVSTSTDSSLIDEKLGDDLFALQNNAEVASLQQQLWRDVREGIIPDVERALAGPAWNLKANLHRIRGYCGSCAMLRLEKVLFEWESQPCLVEAARRYGSLALETASESIEAIEMRYPHLRPGPSTGSH